MTETISRQNYLRKKEPDSRLQIMEGPELDLSPDLNSIELWYELDRRVNEKQPPNN